MSGKEMGTGKPLKIFLLLFSLNKLRKNQGGEKQAAQMRCVY
jgi:hypothetical protein